MQATRLSSPSAPIAGVDEAGRGPLAGPVVAAAVILDRARRIEGLDDSKRLTGGRREALSVEIQQQATAWSVAWADPAEIDAMNILAATMLAMRRAILGLPIMPGRVLIDGNRLPGLVFGGRRIDGAAIVGGDGTVPAISAASIIAKTVRDRIMIKLDDLFPHYEFGRHKGYGTTAHREHLQRYGPCDQHRRSFRPLRTSR